eukprot:jgi/Astpho2/3020/Aster-03329
MRAIQYNKTGGPENLELRELPVPNRGDGEVLIKQYSTSVNPVEVKILAAESTKLPKFKKGDRVYALDNTFLGNQQHGSFQEVVSIPVAHVAHAPKNVPLTEGGGIPLVALTAWQGLEHGTVKAGSRVLVHAGAGGVGIFVIQFAKTRGAHVVSTAGSTNQEFLKSLGVDEPLNYKEADLEKLFSDQQFDFIFDSIGGPATELGYHKLLKKDGCYLEIANTGTDQNRVKKLQESSSSGKGPKYKFMVVKGNGSQLQQVTELIEQDKVRLVVDKTFPLEQSRKGFEYIASSAPKRGKTVITFGLKE